MLWKKKQRISAHDCAHALLNGLVANAWSSFPATIKARQAYLETLEAKTGIYALAAVMLAVGREESADDDFREVRVELEKRVFGPSQTPQAMQTLEIIRGALKAYQSLLNPAAKSMELSWAKNWLLELGIDEANPLILCELAMFWMDFHIVASKSLKQFKIT